MTITITSPRATPARGASIPAPKSPRPGTGLSAAEIRQIVLDILG
ncbi:hypothetical protein [Roseomonas nitratireducens]|nr:hypothetical protein [Neoroseomonas nitratireducens]